MKLPKGNVKIRLAIAKAWEKWRLLIIAIVVLLVSGAVGVYFVGTLSERSEQERQTAAESVSDQVASSITTALTREFDAVRSLIDKTKLAELLATDGGDALESRADILASKWPSILKVRIFAPGKQKVDYTTNPPFTYASLDLVRRFEKEDREPPPDAQLLKTDQAHVVLLSRIANPNGDLVGYVQFSLKPDVVQKVLDSVTFSGDYIEIRQLVAGTKAVVLASRGARSEGQLYSKLLGRTGWQLKFSLEGQAQPEAEDTIFGGSMIWAGVGLLVLLVAGAGLVVLRKWKKTQKFDPEATGVLGGAISTMGEDATRPVDTMVDSYLARTDAKEHPPGSEEQENLDVGLDDSLGDGITELPTGVVYGLDTDTGMNVELTETEGISAAIFRAYDIRGIVGDTLTVEAARSIGQAIGSEAYERGQQAVVVGRDGRLSSQEMASALIEGLRASGRDVIDVGQVPTPVLYFAADYLEAESGVMVTGSHNPANYNGFKIMLGGETLSGDAISAIRGRLGSGNLMTGEGSLQSMDVGAEYIRRVSEDIPVALGGAYKLVVDCGNGVAGEVAPRVYRALGHDVIELYCEVDGNFPNHHPDPIQPENLTDLIRKVREENADLGLAFDGDGDRLVVVDGEGNIIWPDRLLMFFAEDILSRHSGAEVIFDVKCSNRLFRVIEKLGGKPVMWKSGHSLIKQKMKETGAALAGELSGHIFIQDRWYGFDDALYAGARLLEMLRNSKGPPAQTFKHYTTGITTPELRVNMAEGEPHRLMEQLSGQTGLVEGATIIDIDGIRADWPDGWGLVRASNTTPSLVLRFEGDDEAALGRVQEQFRKMLLTVEPGLKLPF